MLEFFCLGWCWWCVSCLLCIYYSETCPLYHLLSEAFTMKGYWILSKAFSASNEMIMWFLSFSLFMGWIMLIYLQYFNIYLWDECYLIMIDDLFDVFLNSFRKYFWELFHLCSSEILIYFSFFCWVLLVLISGELWHCKRNLRCSFPIFWNSLRSIWGSGRILHWLPLGLGLF